jgi:multiple sugar transport system permease protein
MLMVAPTVVIVVAVVVVPVLWNVVLAFQQLSLLQIRSSGIFGTFTTANFAAVLTDSTFWSSLRTTIIYTVGGTLGSIVVGLVAALALRDKFPGRGLVRGAMLLPYVAPVVAVTFVWQLMLNPQFGVVNLWGEKYLGLSAPINFLGQSPYALITVVAFEIWRYFPFAFLFITARLQAIPQDMTEAAIIDGATPLQRFRYILLPQLANVIALLTVLRLIMNFNKFDDVYLLTGGGAGTDVVAVRVYDALTGQFDVGGAAAQSLVLAAFLAVFLAVYMRYFVRKMGETQ